MSTVEDETFTVVGEPTVVRTTDRSVSAYWIDLTAEPDGLHCQPAVRLRVMHDRGTLSARLSDTRVEPGLRPDGTPVIRKEVFSLLGGGRRRERVEPLARFNRRRFDAFYASSLAWAQRVE